MPANYNLIVSWFWNPNAIFNISTAKDTCEYIESIVLIKCIVYYEWRNEFLHIHCSFYALKLLKGHIALDLSVHPNKN